MGHFEVLVCQCPENPMKCTSFNTNIFSILLLLNFHSFFKFTQEKNTTNLSDRVFDGVFGWSFHCNFSDAITCLEFSIFAHSSILHWQLLRCYVPVSNHHNSINHHPIHSSEFQINSLVSYLQVEWIHFHFSSLQDFPN